MLEILLGNYRVVELLGEGSMGVVYVGRHETLGRRVAVKVLQPDLSSHAQMVQRFFNEAQAATEIRNPGIVQVFDFGMTSDGRAYLVMELLEGETLAARLKQRRHSHEECCRLGRQIANVLQAAHAAGITHRDLKPDNLFLVPDAEMIGGERVKVLDFGIAKLVGDARSSGGKTFSDLAMGTASYMSPEQCRSASAADARSDIYSLGCILFEVACRRPPFGGRALGDVVAGHLHSTPPHPQSLAPDMPAELSALIARMLAKAPAARPQTMTEVSYALDEILRTLGGSAARGSTPAPRARVALPGLPPVTPLPLRVVAPPLSIIGLAPRPATSATPPPVPNTARLSGSSNGPASRPILGSTPVPVTSPAAQHVPVVVRIPVAAPTPPSGVATSPRPALGSAPIAVASPTPPPVQTAVRIPARVPAQSPANGSPTVSANGAPALPANGAPAVSANGAPALPANSAPAVSANSAPALPANCAPVLPTDNAPALPPNNAHALPANDSSPLPTVGSPVFTTYGSSALRGIDSRELPAYDSPVLPAYGSPELSGYGSPMRPTNGSPVLVNSPPLPTSSPRLPASSLPLPANGSPALPANGSPALPANGAPAPPTNGSPAFPANGSLALPANGAPALPANSAPALPINRSPALPINGAPALPTNAASLPTNAASLPTNAASLPTNAASLPANSASLPTNSASFPTNSASLPANGASLPTNSASLPANGTSLPANGTSLPANGTSLPANGKSLPTNSASLPASAASIPANRVPAIPVNGPPALPANRAPALRAAAASLPAAAASLPANAASLSATAASLSATAASLSANVAALSATTAALSANVAVPLPANSAVPLPATSPTSHPVPQAPPMSTALLSTAETSSIASPPAPTRRLPFALGGLLIGAAATAIVFVFANQHPGSPRTPVAHDESTIAAPGPNTDAVEVAAPPQRHALRPTQPTQRTQPTIAPAKPPQPTNAPARIPQPAVAASDLEAECRGYAGDRKWEALAHCADQLKPLDPKRAVELATRAAGEARSAPRIAGVESALHDKHLKQAKTELDQVWTESVEYARLKHAYEIQESQAIDDLAARLDRVKSASCEEYNQLLAKERPLNPLRVTAEAIRRIPCAAPPKCNADTLAEKALAQYNANQIAESLALYDAAYACRPALPLLQKAFVIACNLRDATKARSYWKRLPPALGTQALPACAHNDITEAMLNAP